MVAHGFLFSVLTLGVPAGVDAAEVFVLPLLPLSHDFDSFSGGGEAALQTFVRTLSTH